MAHGGTVAATMHTGVPDVFTKDPGGSCVSAPDCRIFVVTMCASRAASADLNFGANVRVRAREVAR
jgi:hypothetical protein